MDVMTTGVPTPPTNIVLSLNATQSYISRTAFKMLLTVWPGFFISLKRSVRVAHGLSSSPFVVRLEDVVIQFDLLSSHGQVVRGWAYYQYRQ